MFSGKRLKIAREFRGWTQTKLAEQVAASCALISLCEAGKKKHPARDLVQACGSVLGFAPEFFDSDKDVFHEDEGNFRHRRTTPERMKAQVRAHGTLIGLVAQRFLGVRFPPINIPWITASTFEEIETAAEHCREHWKLRIDTPLVQIGEVLEDAGVVIVRHVVKSTKVDTFSYAGGGMTMILPNQEIQSGPRWNFEMAHELGHFVMHRRILTGTVETERAANRFASAFLIPRRAFAREFQAKSFSWRHVYKLKIRWQMPAAAIVRRAYDLRLLGAVEYRKAVKHMSVKGWTKREPYERALRYSERFENAVNYLAQRGSLPTFCEELRFTPDTFRDVTGIAITPRNIVPSSGTDTRSAVSIGSPNPSEPVVATTPASDSSSAPVAQPTDPYGIASIRSGTKEIFLLRGVDNCELARHCAQQDRAVGVERWHREYMDLPVLKAVERVWVVINRSDDRDANTRFLRSIAADASMCERSRIATVKSETGMIGLFKWVLQEQRSRAFSGNRLESVFQFKTVPLPDDTKEMEALTEPPPPPEPWPIDPGTFWWQR